MSNRTIDFRFAPTSRWANIGRPDDPFKSLVREDGALLLDWQGPVGDVGGSGYFKKVLSLGAYNAQKPASVTQRSDKASNNIVITRLDYAFCVLTLTAFGHVHEGLRTDVVLWNLRIKPGMASMPAALSVNVDERFRICLLYTSPSPRD